MAETKKHVRIFLASPSDLQAERRIAKSVVENVNKMWSDFFGYYIDLVGWEDTLPQYGRAQAVINQDLETCELFIGMLWERWGTPPSKDSAYGSGFEEEFDISIKSRRANGHPEIFMFLKDMDPKLVGDPGNSAKKVIEFRERLIADKELKYETFANPSEFEQKVMAALTRYLQTLVTTDQEKIHAQSQSTPSESTTGTENASNANEAAVLPTQSATFLRDFVSTAQGNGGEEIDSTQVARFRLLGGIVAKGGNDEETLGAHDANLLFAARTTINFGDKELSGLMRAGLEHFSSENVPLWHWYGRLNGFADKDLGYFSIFRAPKWRVGALSAMTLINEPLPTHHEIERSDFLDSWFGPSSTDTLKIAALNYLSEAGTKADIPTIKTELDRGNYQTRAAALDAIVSINVRDGQEKALLELFELQVDSVGERLISRLYEKPQRISDETLLNGLTQRVDGVRRASAKALADRKLLTPEIAEKLLADNDAEVRLIALLALAKAERNFSETEAKAILVRSAGTGLFGMGTKVGEPQYAQFREQMLFAKNDQELEEQSSRANIFERDAESIRFEKYYARYRTKLLALIEDRYAAPFATALDEMAARYGDSQLVKDTKSLEDYLRKKFVRRGIDIVCRKGGKSELPFLRKTLVDEFVAYSSADIGYLGKHGEWEDIPLIISLLERSNLENSLLTFAATDKYQLGASALHRIAKGRVSELLDMPMSKMLLPLVIAQFSNKEFREIRDDQVKSLLLSETDRVRKITALKCVLGYGKERLRAVLDEYTSGDRQRYYNVIHWLDLGVSAPKAVAQRAVSRIIAKDFD